jgi:hypothetical protein
MILLGVGVFGLARSPLLAALNEDDAVAGRREPRKDEVPHGTVPGTS